VKGQRDRQVMAEDLRGPVVGKGGQVTGGERASRIGIANPYLPAVRGQLEGVEMGK
jgi:hypothetical protein